MQYKVSAQKMRGQNRAIIIYWTIKLNHVVYNNIEQYITLNSYIEVPVFQRALGTSYVFFILNI